VDDLPEEHLSKRVRFGLSVAAKEGAQWESKRRRRWSGS
jgi:hypothetical protein